MRKAHFEWKEAWRKNWQNARKKLVKESKKEIVKTSVFHAQSYLWA
jgi:hypothetical protein